MIGRAIAHYEIVEKLGEGGMGVVYKARDTHLDRFVAIKVLPPERVADPERKRRFVQEAKAASALNHPSIITIHDISSDAGHDFITMEYVAGKTLDRLIGHKGLGLKETLDYAIQATGALTKAHGAGIVHRDLKPSNIMVTGDGLVKVLDFGLAKLTETALGEDEATRTVKPHTEEGTVVGTAAYMSPEQARGEELDARTDLFSFGTVLYEMATGRPAFSGGTVAVLLDAILHKAPTAPVRLNLDCPAELERIINRALEKDRELRYQTTSDLRADLQRLKRDSDSVATVGQAAGPGIPAGHGEVSKEGPPVSEPITGTSRFRSGLWLAAVLVAAVCAITAYMRWPSPKRATPSVAVLPFTDISPAKSHEWLCLGMTDTLINVLSSIPDLRVPGSASISYYRTREVNYSEIGQRLGVKAVLEGSIQVAGKDLKVSVRLIDAASGYQIWSQVYTKSTDAVLTLQDEIALAVADKLKVTLLGEDGAKLTRHGTRDVAAYEAYVKGKSHRYEERPKDMLLARDYFDQAVRKDPSFALAFAGQAENYMVLGLYSVLPRDEAATSAVHNARRALELDPSLSEAHVSMGVIKMVFDWDWKGAETEFRRALALKPNNFDVHREYALLLVRTYRYDEAENEFLQGQRIDPLNAVLLRDLLGLYVVRGKTQEAEAVKRQLENLRPEWVRSWDGTSWSIEECKREIETDGRYPWSVGSLAVAYHQAGDSVEAGKLIRELQSLYESGREGNVACSLANVFCHLGDKEKTLDWLDRAVERKAPGLINVDRGSSFGRLLRDEPRFQAILKRVGVK